MEVFFIVGVSLALVGVVFLAVGIILCLKGNNKKKYTGKTTGRITDMCKNAQSFNSGGDGEGLHFGVYISTRSGKRSKKSSCPIFTYTVDGVQYTRADNMSNDVKRIERMMGRTVDVYYNPENPMDARLTVTSPLCIVGIIFILISIPFLGFGISLLRW